MISVIIPAYNEASHIGKNIKEASSALKSICREYEIIVVDDGSNDGTYEEAVKKAGAFGYVRVLRLKRNEGKGRAILAGWRAARGETVVLTDADLEIHPCQVRTLLETLEEKKADLVVGSRRHAASVLKYPQSRKMMSYAYNLFVRLLFLTRLRDTQAGLKVMRKKAADTIMPKLRISRFAFDVELLMVAHHFGFRIEEAPVRVEFARKNSWGRYKAWQILGMICDTLKIFYWLYFKRVYLKALKKELRMT